MSDRKREPETNNTERKDRKELSNTNTLDGGVIAFGEWLMSAEDPSARCGPLALRRVANDAQVIVYDSILGQEVIVRMIDGVPRCNTCQDDLECMHIGFSICAVQMHRRNAI